MKVTEVMDPSMKVRVEQAKLASRIEELEKAVVEQKQEIYKLRMSLLATNDALKKLINKLGPQK